jgi:chromosome segregation ATPase
MAAPEERQAAALASTVAWLEDELRETRAALAKLAQAFEQTQTQLWELTNRLHRVEDAVGAIPPQLAALPRLDGQLAQVKDQLGAVQEEGLHAMARLTELDRELDAAIERERQARNELTHRLETVERQVRATASRVETVEESVRRALEAVSLARQRSDEIARDVDGLEGRLGRLLEAGNRLEHEQARLAGELDGLRRQDELVLERVQVYVEMVKRLEGQIALVAADVAVKQDVLEKIELARVETHRLEERLAALEAAAETLRDQSGELERAVGLLEGRQKGFQERLTALQADLAAQRTFVNEQFQRLHQLQERLKRRQIEDLERDLREIRIFAFRTAEEQ